jgi:TolB protein
MKRIATVLIQTFLKALIIGLSIASPPALARLNISIIGIGSHLYPIAVANFHDNRPTSDRANSIDAIIRNDLARSGRFNTVTVPSNSLSETEAVDFKRWRARGADALVSGSLFYSTGDHYNVRFRVFDTVSQKNLGGLLLTSSFNGLRASAHRAADYIYQRLLGERGIFSTRLAYIVQTGSRYQLQISDADGYFAQTALTSHEPIISPAWSPDGKRLAYVSFEQGKPVVYLHELSTGRRTILSNQKGSNSAPAWSPDGAQLAVALSLSGNTQIYSIDIAKGTLRRLSHTQSIDTEPQFSADGKRLYFTSDRGGSPQIYEMSAQGELIGGPAKRITFKGRYNTTPRISPDGRLLAYISRIQGAYKLYVQELQTHAVTALTDTTSDDSPSFAANSKYLLYATQFKGRDVLATVSIDGRTRQILSVSGASVRDPCWGPLIKNSGE